MCNPDAVYYDHDLAQAYLEAQAQAPKPVPTTKPNNGRAVAPTRTLSGHVRWMHLSDEDVERFCELVAGGMPRDLAARQIETSLVQLHRKASREPEVAEMIEQAYQTGYPHYQDWLSGKVVEFIENGNYNALRDQLLMHLPEAEKLRTSKHEHSGPGGGPIMQIKAVLHGLPRELLEQVIEHVEAGEEQRAIEMLNERTEAA